MTPIQASQRPPMRATEFAELTRSVKHAGLLDRRRGYYILRITVNLLVLAGGGVLFVLVGDSWWQLFTAVFFAVIFTQFAFIGHDAGHRQIFRGKRANDAIGYVHGGIVGMSYGWWVSKHHRHHANPNHEQDDPDIDIPFLAFTPGQSRAKRGILRWMTKYQAYLFFPLLLLEGINLHVSSAQAVWRGQVASRKLEAGLLLAHIGGYLAAVFLVLSPGTAVAFIAVHQGLMGIYLGCSFAPNHKGMPTWTSGVSLDFLRRQVLTSRNVRGGPWIDFVYGGLNYQIEHHLFPTMPRPNLRKAQPLVHRFCLDHGIDYSQCGLLRSYWHVLHHLHALGAPLRAAA
ncbi:fatty acid desaturase family protein [Haloechinothrix halophila]|uniref:fatty acid desaturase family protein n=1 Tax=Haloechinothrix halophila TaxID=1069073 RepID=UPI000555FEE7|nr:acyl-CoA desaturase [Haloechinothrix halophila]